jgi:hypothetical protein
MYDLPGTPDLNLLIPQLSSIRVVDRPDIGPTGSSRKCADDGVGRRGGAIPRGDPARKSSRELCPSSPDIRPRKSVVPGNGASTGCTMGIRGIPRIWSRSVVACSKCRQACLQSGSWPDKICLNEGPLGPRWPGSGDPWEPVYPEP